MDEQAAKLKVYLAAPWSEKARMQGVREQFREAGFEVTSRWLDYPEGLDTGLEIAPEKLRAEALKDIEDILVSHLFVLINSQKRGEETSGKAVELGVAIATFKGVIIVGEPTNVFHYLRVTRVGTVEEAIEEAKQWKPTEYAVMDEVIGAVRSDRTYESAEPTVHASGDSSPPPERDERDHHSE